MMQSKVPSLFMSSASFLCGRGWICHRSRLWERQKWHLRRVGGCARGGQLSGLFEGGVEQRVSRGRRIDEPVMRMRAMARSYKEV
jgi:hypothetical protein